MFKNFIFILFSCILLTAHSGENFDNGVELFNANKFQKSAKIFGSIIQENPNDVGALFNLGMAKMKSKKWGEAIWAFEKTLLYTPNDVESKEMIEECHYELDPNYYWEYRLNATQSMLYSISSSAWAILSILFSLLIAASAMLFKRNTSLSSKRIFAIIGTVSVFLFLFTIITGYYSKQHRTANNFAIVTSKSIESVYEKTQVNEGAILEILNSQPTDTEIRVETIDGTLLSFKPEQLTFL